MKNLFFTKAMALILLFFPASLSLWAAESLFEKYSEEEFRKYWFDDTAELTHYALSQARYGELREGSATLIFVTEPMNTRLQVKADSPYDGKKIKDVLKVNYTKKFNTGVYPYSVMTSVFTPIENKGMLLPEKITLSVQEWCGQVFTQLNLGLGRYKGKSFSYFEKEADEIFSLKNVMTEDGLWNLIRISPNDLPTGNFELIPSLAISRLKHIKLRPEKVKGDLIRLGADTAVYTVEFLESERTLSVTISTAFPYEINEWEETYVSGWGDGAAKLTTRATIVERMNLDYWKKNSEADSVYRSKLGF